MSYRGWIKIHRRIIDSDIYQLSPLYLRVFERLIIEANHHDKEIPFRYTGSEIVTKKLIKRGERQTSIRQICEWVGWYENGLFKKPNPKTIKQILDWLVVNDMIQIIPTDNNREGTHYKVMNYSDYQTKDDEEVTVKKQSSNSKETVDGSKQEDIKNDENVKEVNIPLQIKDLRLRYSESQLQNIDEYLDVLRWTRKNGNIADSVILKIYKAWEKFKPDVVIHSLQIYINNPKYHDKKEQYCYGIMRNAKDEDVYKGVGGNGTTNKGNDKSQHGKTKESEYERLVRLAEERGAKPPEDVVLPF
ncbi:MAG TPA: hypothetical protein GX707_13930 [Epulopiscium sp.]|nr:hypothetical protein [Candidatus Epulonipiscium sp.]